MNGTLLQYIPGTARVMVHTMCVLSVFCFIEVVLLLDYANTALASSYVLVWPEKDAINVT